MSIFCPLFVHCFPHFVHFCHYFPIISTSIDCNSLPMSWFSPRWIPVAIPRTGIMWGSRTRGNTIAELQGRSLAPQKCLTPGLFRGYFETSSCERDITGPLPLVICKRQSIGDLKQKCPCFVTRSSFSEGLSILARTSTPKLPTLRAIGAKKCWIKKPKSCSQSD